MSSLLFNEEIQSSAIGEVYDPSSVTEDGFMIEQDQETLTNIIQQHIEGIELGLETINSLERIKNALKKNSKPSKSAFKIGMLAVEELKKNTGLFKDGTLVAVENFTEDNISLEGFTDLIKTIWDAIVRTFKAIWNSIINLFKDNRIANREKQIKEIQENSKKVKDSGEKVVIENKRDVLSSAQQLQPFYELGSKITLKDLLQSLDKMHKSVSICDSILRQIDHCNMNFETALVTLDNTKDMNAAMAYFRQAINLYYDIANNGFTGSNDLDKFKKELVEKINISYNSVDRETIRSLQGLTRGDRIFIFRQQIVEGSINQDGYEFLQLTNRSDIKKYPELDISESDFTDSVHIYSAAIERVNVEFKTFREKYVHLESKIRSKQEDILKKLGNMLHKVSTESRGENIPSEKECIIFYRHITRSLSKMVLNLNTCIVKLERSYEDHLELLSFMNSLLPKVSK